ncbi:MAG: GGDEF domain-containing protein [Sedimentisphaerales bacterium]|nr:GGDEF domain-containing protein [Sedimentisphaerales bacterium]
MAKIMAGEGEILLIGNLKDAFSSVYTENPNIKVCAKISDGIEAAGKYHFETVAVVMADASKNLRTGLATLRKKTNARIVLLARMFEEPTARGLIDSAGNGSALADDYIICPVGFDKFRQDLISEKQAVDFQQFPAPNTTLLTKIHRLEKLATEDDLTGVKNRRYIFEFARQIIERAKKENGRVTVLIFDIDDLKHYNDVYGHAAGDEVLKQAAILIRRCCRKHDVVGRIGGDEFAVIFWGEPRINPPVVGNERRSFAEHPKEAILIARRFRKELEKADLHLPGAKNSTVLTVSGGLASFDRDGSTAQELLASADQALLDAKRSGKNRVYLVGHPENDIDKIEQSD